MADSDDLAGVANFSVHDLLRLAGKAHDRDVAKARAEHTTFVSNFDGNSGASKNANELALRAPSPARAPSPRQITFERPEQEQVRSAPLPSKVPPTLDVQDTMVEEVHDVESSVDLEHFAGKIDQASPREQNGGAQLRSCLQKSKEEQADDVSGSRRSAPLNMMPKLSDPLKMGPKLSDPATSSWVSGGSFNWASEGHSPNTAKAPAKTLAGLMMQENANNNAVGPPSPSLSAINSGRRPSGQFKIAFSEEPESIPAARGIATAIERKSTLIRSNTAGSVGALGTATTPPGLQNQRKSLLLRGLSHAALLGKEPDEFSREQVALKIYSEWNRSLMNKDSDALTTIINADQSRRRSSLGQAFQDAHLRRERTRMGWMGSIDDRWESTTRKIALDRLVIAPNALRRIWWNSAGLLCILFDLIMIPLQVFDFENNQVLNWIGFMFTMFWSADLGLNFFTGYYCKSGIIELNLKRIAKNYLKGWFLPDLCLAAIDWLVFFAEVAADNVALLRIGKSMRLGKSLRLLRLARLAKMDGLWADIMKQVNSEEFSTIAALVVRICNILICSHWIACGWFGQTLIGGQTWVKYHLETTADNDATARYDGPQAAIQYTTSLHWTLTQFTPASMEVFPHNLRERIINIGVLLFGLVTFTSLISRISNAMSHLQTLNSSHFLTKHKLRQWLRENKVSMNLVARVWACIKESSKQNRRTPQKDVVVLQQLPKSIMAELYHEIYEPILQTHPFLGPYIEFNLTGLRQLCSAAVSELYLFPGDELFTAGEPAAKAFFLNRGTILYDTDPSKIALAIEQNVKKNTEINAPLARCNSKILESVRKKKPVIEAGQWISEVALWVEWVYRGPAVAAEYSELVAIAGNVFREILKKVVMHDHMLGKYASLFAQRAVHELDMLDIWFESEILEDLAWCAFYEGADFSVSIPLSDDAMHSDSEEEGSQRSSTASDPDESISIPLAATTELQAQEVEDQLQRWHARVRDMRSDMEEESEIEKHTGWAWSSIFPKLRDSVGRVSGERNSPKGSVVQMAQTPTGSWNPAESTRSEATASKTASRRSGRSNRSSRRSTSSWSKRDSAKSPKTGPFKIKDGFSFHLNRQT